LSDLSQVSWLLLFFEIFLKSSVCFFPFLDLNA
jgi:hypothetical protein